MLLNHFGANAAQRLYGGFGAHVLPKRGEQAAPLRLFARKPGPQLYRSHDVPCVYVSAGIGRVGNDTHVIQSTEIENGPDDAAALVGILLVKVVVALAQVESERAARQISPFNRGVNIFGVARIR